MGGAHRSGGGKLRLPFLGGQVGMGSIEVPFGKHGSLSVSRVIGRRGVEVPLTFC